MWEKEKRQRKMAAKKAQKQLYSLENYEKMKNPLWNREKNVRSDFRDKKPIKSEFWNNC